MARTIHNSKACSCCGRLMPVAKRGKRKSCSPQCIATLKRWRRKHGAKRTAAHTSERPIGLPATKEATP